MVNARTRHKRALERARKAITVVPTSVLHALQLLGGSATASHVAELMQITPTEAGERLAGWRIEGSVIRTNTRWRLHGANATARAAKKAERESKRAPLRSSLAPKLEPLRIAFGAPRTTERLPSKPETMTTYEWREHKACKSKVTYMSEDDARHWAGVRGQKAYRCMYCNKWHLHT